LICFLLFKKHTGHNITPAAVSENKTETPQTEQKQRILKKTNKHVLRKPTYQDPLDDPSLWVYKEDSKISKKRLPFIIQETSGYIYEADIIYTDNVKIVIVTTAGKQVKLDHEMIWSITRNPEYHELEYHK
jgi:hypothetical protein